MIDEYFINNIISKNELKGYFINNKSETKLVVLNGYSWEKGNPEDMNDLLQIVNKNIIKTITPITEKLNNITGYIVYFEKHDNIVFKIRNMEQSRNKGACCTQKPMIEQYLKDIYDKHSFPDKPFDTKKITLIELCILLEFILRFFNKKNVNKKSWFLNSFETSITKLETIKS